MTKITFRRQYNDQRKRDDFQSKIPTQSETQEAFKEEVDINRVVALYQRTGNDQLLSVAPRPFGDDPRPTDYHTVMNRVAEFTQDFEMLDSKTRKEFDNDPLKMLDWVSDPENKQEAIKKGYLPASQNEQIKPSADASGTPVPDETKKASQEASVETNKDLSTSDGPQ